MKFRKCQIINNLNFNILFLNHCRFDVILPDGRIRGFITHKTKTWTYVTLNFNVQQQAIWVYQDGKHLLTYDTKEPRGELRQGNGRIVVGKATSNKGQFGFASVELDQLRIFNRMVTEAEIKILSQQ